MGKFRIKIQPSWFSDDYAVLRYSTNGIFWKNIKDCKCSVNDDLYYMSPKTIYYSSAPCVLSQFKTIEDVEKYERERRERMIRENTKILERKKRHIEERNNIYKKFC